MERIRRFFRKLGKGLKAKGYTLIEVAAVVAVTGTLAAVAMPVVADKIAAGKLAAAQNDCNAIKDAIVNFVKDTGVPPFYTDVTTGTLLALPKSTTGTYHPVLVTSDGINPSDGTASWTFPVVANSPSVAVDAQLNTNTPKYPTMGISAWKGPYLPSVSNLIRKDPWGNKYLVSIKGLTESSDAPPVMRGVFVISAGPNGIIETKFEQIVKYLESATQAVATGFAVNGDDIIARIQ